MNDTQLYLVAGLPTLAVLIGALLNAMLFNGHFGTLSAGFTLFQNSMASVDARMASMENKMTSLESKFDVRLDIVMSKLAALDNRLTRVEDRLEHIR